MTQTTTKKKTTAKKTAWQKLTAKEKNDVERRIDGAIRGWSIPVLDIPEVYAAGEAAGAAGEDVTAAVYAVLDRVAERVPR